MKKNKNTRTLNEIGGHARQGDVLIRRISERPRETKTRLKFCTLALGEVTGHHHTIHSGAEGYGEMGDKLASHLEVMAAMAELTHQEHETILVPEGTYESLKQVEYTPQEIRRVTD